MGLLLAQEAEDIASDGEGSVVARGAFSTKMRQQKPGRTSFPHSFAAFEGEEPGTQRTGRDLLVSNSLPSFLHTEWKVRHQASLLIGRRDI